MAKVLIATIPAIGHVTPLLLISEQLVKRGHIVAWYTGSLFQSRVESTGAIFKPIRSAADYTSIEDVPNELIDKRESLKGSNQLKFDIKNFFVEPAFKYFDDIVDILDEFQADIIIADSFFIAASWINEKFLIPWVQVSISVLSYSGKNTAPFGLGLQPSSSLIGKLRNQILKFLSDTTVLRESIQDINKFRNQIGLLDTNISFLDYLSPNLHLIGSVKEFEYPREHLPKQVHFVGPLALPLVENYEHPAWWNDLVSFDKPVVLVTQGTVALNLEDLVFPAIMALQSDDIFIIATTGGKSIDNHGYDFHESNVKLENFVPFDLLMPHVDVMITNGGFNGVMSALKHGIPLIVAGKTEDKAEVSGRVEFAQVGINLKTSQPKPSQIKSAVGEILSDPSYSNNSKKMQQIIQQTDPSIAIDLIVQFLET